MRKYLNFIDGGWIPALTAANYCTSNPADTREVVATYPRSEAVDAIAAIDAAQKALPSWRSLTPVGRGRILSRASQLLEERHQELSELLTREEGKTLAESQGEVRRAIDIFRFFGGLSYTIGGQTIPHDSPGNFLFTMRQPLGVVGLITPWNFPIAIPAWKIAPALVTGNTVVIKPATQTPAMTLELAKALADAGLPKGVLNVVVGEGSSVGKVVVNDPRVAAISFTGSYSVGHGIYTHSAARMARTQLEMGSKNPTLVLADADLDLAASLVVKAGFGLTGQACTATSRVIVDKSVMDAFTEKLLIKTREVKVGNGMVASITMGPAVSQNQLDANLAHVRNAVQAGAQLLSGGKRMEREDCLNGYFMEPVVLGGVTPGMQIAKEEVFGPVVGIIQVNGFDEALAVANGVDAGLSATVVTKDLRKAMLFAERIEAGVVKINQISTGLALQAPFGGVKKSSTDSFKEQGAGAIEFYSRLKSVYIDYSV